jgi:quercetin dioxygenase-like cupin family protein
MRDLRRRCTFLISKVDEQSFERGAARVNSMQVYNSLAFDSKGGNMKRSLFALAVVAGLVVAWTIGRVQGQSESKVVFVDSAKANFTPMQQNPDVSTAPVWGDASTGAHATFTKFKPGYDAGMHTHTNDVSIVVVKGAYLYKDENGEKRVGPGDFLRVPGGHKHWSGGDKKEGALFYEEGSEKFDFNPVK